MKNKLTLLKIRKNENFLYSILVTPEGKNSRKNIKFLKKFEESLIKVSERSERKMALVV